MTLNEAFVILRIHYKNHLAAAEALGFSATHYRALRNGRANIRKRTESLILSKAEECRQAAAGGES